MASHGSDRVENDCYLDDEETSVVQLARAGQLKELQQLLNDMDPGDILDSVCEHDAKNNSALHYAARIDNLDMVKLLVQHGADVNIVGEAGRRPLHLAAGTKKDLAKVVAAKKISDEGVVKFLLSKNAHVNNQDSRGRTPLHTATLQGNTEAVIQLLSNSDTKLNKADIRKMTPLLLACLHGEIDIAILLINKGADLTVYDENSDTPLHIAINEGNKQIVRKIVEKAKETDKLKEILIETNSDGVAPIHLAVRGGHTELVQLSLKHGLKVDQAMTKDGDTPLHEACSAGHLDIVMMLCREMSEPQINITNLNGETPLHHACKENHHLVADLLVAKRADMSIKNDEELTPLQVATNSGSFDTIIRLLDCISNRVITLPVQTVYHANTHTQQQSVGGGCLYRPSPSISSQGLMQPPDPLENDAPGCAIPLIYQHHSATRSDDCHDAASEYIKWAATENKAKTLQLLLQHGVGLHSVNDDRITGFILDAAKKGHTETVAALIRWKRSDVVNKRDYVGNTPLHCASKAGHDLTVQELIKAKADVNVTNFAHEQTPLHLAAAKGWIRTVKQLLKANARVDKTDSNEKTPLHLACKKGHIDMVKLLVYEEKANILLRDKHGLNCLDYAIDNGHENIANLILSHDKWREVMSVSSLDDDTNERTTPMRKLIKNMPDVAERVMDRCIEVSPDTGPKDSKFRVEFDYELLEDSFSNWDRPNYSDGNSRRGRPRGSTKSKLLEVAGAFDEQDEGVSASTAGLIFRPTPTVMGVGDESVSRGRQPGVRSDGEGRNQPDEGDEVKTTETSFSTKPYRQSASDSKTDKDKADKYKKIPETPTAPMGDQYDDHGHLMKSARPYTTSSKDMAANHPLNIMVTSERADLLGHPLVSSLLNHKWSRVGQYVFLASLGSYLLFVVMLTGYVIVVPPSYYVRHANQSAGVSWFLNGDQRWTAGFHEATIFFFGRIGDWIILVLSLINLLREVFQLLVQRRSYFCFVNLIEWSLYVLAILLVLPLSGVQYLKGVSLRLGWQWQCGAVAVFLAWINLILFIRRFSGLGIYVIMFIDILRTFMKFVLILILFVVAFAMAFYTLLMNQQPFHSVQYSFAKTFVMMIGELDFGTIFHSQNYLGTENTLANGEEDFFLTSVFYEGITYTIFALFLIIMSILIMNLLVGLAVDDIHAIQEKAKLHRLAMQVELVMEVQRYLPIFIWRSAVIRSKFFKPKSCCSGLQKWYRTLNGDQNILQQAIQVGKKTKTQGGFMHEEVTTHQLVTDLKYRLKKTGVEQKQMKERFERLENKIDALLNHIKVKWDDESKTDAK